jgi:predicted CxxxxCH...CXXCH cytochrome family protein
MGPKQAQTSADATLHALHQSFCTDCHDVPKTVAQADHITGAPRLTFSGLATTGGLAPAWDPASRTCSNVYCHASQKPTWAPPPSPIACDSCHGTPPASHAPWSRVATPPAGASPADVASTCARCHLVPTPGATPAPGDTHVNGKIDFAASIACDTCHGHDATGAPPVSLDGSTDPSAHGVGAHAAHLDDNFAGRIGHVVACSTCHTVPATVTTPGHLDHPLPAIVSLPQNGTYDPATRTCNVWCHWGANAGSDSAAGIELPTWTDTSGTILSSTCTSCHGFPPTTLRDGTPHTHAPPVLSACTKCHPFTIATHVDGVVELLP